MFEVCITYYDSPREDCSGYYYDVLEVPTVKEAWFIAKHINREDEPKAACVDLKSGKPVYAIYFKLEEYKNDY